MPDVTFVKVYGLWEPAVLLLSVTTFPEVPVTDHVPIKVPRLPVSVIVCATVFVDASSATLALFRPSVLMPVAPPMVSLLRLKPPETKVLATVDVLDNRMSAVPLLRVSPVMVVVLHTAPVPVRVHKPEPIDRVRVLLLLLLNVLSVTL
jgi:hypothetical protein